MHSLYSGNPAAYRAFHPRELPPVVCLKLKGHSEVQQFIHKIAAALQ